MSPAAPVVFAWPQQRAQVLRQLALKQIAVISLVTPTSAQRDFSRQQIRLALTELLTATFTCPPEQIRLVSEPGKASCAMVCGRQIAVSFSHETGLSLAAISLADAVGVDLVRLDEHFDWQPLAELYLGDVRTKKILAHPCLQQFHIFVQAWTNLEASLKCCGLALAEFSEPGEAALNVKLAKHSHWTLDLPRPYQGTLVLKHG